MVGDDNNPRRIRLPLDPWIGIGIFIICLPMFVMAAFVTVSYLADVGVARVSSRAILVGVVCTSTVGAAMVGLRGPEIFWATRKSDSSLVRALIAQEHSVRSRTLTRQTPLHVAAALGNLDVVQILLDAGSNPNAVDLLQRTPFYVAQQLGNEHIARVLSEHAQSRKLLDHS